MPASFVLLLGLPPFDPEFNSHPLPPPVLDRNALDASVLSIIWSAAKLPFLALHLSQWLGPVPDAVLLRPPHRYPRLDPRVYPGAAYFRTSIDESPTSLPYQKAELVIV